MYDVINLDELDRGNPAWEDLFLEDGTLHPTDGYLIETPRPVPLTFRKITKTCSVPALLPRPEWHVGDVRVRRDAKYAYLKHKMRRMARDRLSGTRT